MADELPFFSVVVPTYERPRQLAACLRSLGCLDYPRERFEVVVVDDGSATPPGPVVGPFRERLPLTLLTQANAGPAAARNAGAARARGEVLAFLDDDCAPTPGWLRALAARLAAAPGHLVGGRTVNALPDNLCSAASQLLVDYLYAAWNAAPGPARFFASNNMAVPAQRFQAVGGFDPAFARAAGEDRDFCRRWLGHGYPMTYAPEAVVYHAHALTLSAFWRQQVNYGRGGFAFHRSRAHGGGGGGPPERLSFYLHLLRYPFEQARGRRALALSALTALSQAAVAAGYFLGWVCPATHRPSRGGIGRAR